MICLECRRRARRTVNRAHARRCSLHTDNHDRVLYPYLLPDGRIVNVDDTAAKGEQTITFELERIVGGARRFVRAERLPACECCGEPAGAGGALCPACAANHGVEL